MRPSNGIVLVLLLVSAMVAGCRAPSEPLPTAVSTGRLGHPLGTWVAVEGVRQTQGKVGPGDFLVDRIDGRAIVPAIAIHVDGLDLPPDERCAFAGYETGRWVGMPPEVARKEGLPLTQAAWQFATSFVVTSVRSPESLVLRARERGLLR